MKTMKAKMLIVMLVCLFVVGCITSVDPTTGETLKSLDPNTVSYLENLAGTTRVILGILGAWWPILLPIAGYIGGAVRISKKLTPKLTEAQTEAQMYYTAALSTALGIEEFKKEFPDQWSALENQLNLIKDKIISAEDKVKIENLIRGLRGLPPIA